MISRLTIRSASPSDFSLLKQLERDLFPTLVRAGERALVYSNNDVLAMLNAAAGTRTVEHLVAAIDDAAVGFAVARVFTLPGDGQRDPDRNVLLDRVAVSPEFRRRGVAADLVHDVVKRMTSVGSHLALAHISAAAVPFYRAIGWNVGPHGHGLAWRPKASFLHADLPDARLGFPVMAWRVLRTSGLHETFTFPRRTGIPTLDAVHALKERIDRGTVARADLDEVALTGLDMLDTLGAPPARGAFGQRIV